MKYTALIFIFLLASVSFAAFPRPVGFVNDFANVLTNGQALDGELASYEQNTSIEIAVVTIEQLPADQTAATYANELFADWGIGKKGEDNGLLILIIKNGTVGNRLRIELGYGIQGYITGAESGRILDDALPYYEQGDYDTTANVIVSGLQDQLVSYVPGQPVQSNDLLSSIISSIGLLPLAIFFILIIVSIIMSNRCPYCFGKLKCSGDICTCTKCGRKITRRKRYAPILIAGGFGGGSGGGGGFGGGGSGGGGAGR